MGTCVHTAYALIEVKCCKYDSRCKRCVADSGILRDIEWCKLHICNEVRHMYKFSDEGKVF